MVTTLSSDRLMNPNELRGMLARTHKWWEPLRLKNVQAEAGRHPVNVPMIYTYSAHAIELSKAVMELHRSGHMFASLPLVRSSMECAMTAAWLSVSDDETTSFLHATATDRRKALRDVKRLTSSDVNDALAEVDRALDQLEGKETEPGRNLKARFEALVGGAELYVSYRVLSGLTHPSALLTDQYLTEQPETTLNPYGLGLRSEVLFDEKKEASYLGTTLCMVVVALIAFDSTQPDRPLRSQLARITRQIGIADNIRRVDAAD